MYLCANLSLVLEKTIKINLAKGNFIPFAFLFLNFPITAITINVRAVIIYKFPK